MWNRKSRRLLFVALTVGSLFAEGVSGGCWNVGTKTFMSSIQPCGIFNCSGTLFNGAISLCGQPGNSADDIVKGCP